MPENNYLIPLLILYTCKLETSGHIPLPHGNLMASVDVYVQLDALLLTTLPDPDGVLKLLQSALSMEKLSTLLKEEHLRDTQLLPQLQNRLEGEGVVVKRGGCG